MKINKLLILSFIIFFLGLSHCGRSRSKNIALAPKEKQNINGINLTKASGSVDKCIDKYVSTNYEIVYRVEEIPESIHKLLLNKFNNKGFANPNEDFNPTDVIWDHNLPQRRLVFAGNSPDSWFVCYEHGGIGYHCHMIIFSIENKEMQVLFNGGCSKPQNPDQLKQWVVEHKVEEAVCW